MKRLNKNDFKNAVARGRILVCFGAEWCPPCRAMVQRLEALKCCRTGYIDVTENLGLAREYEAFKLPLLVLFGNGKEIRRAIGPQSIEYLKSFVKK